MVYPHPLNWISIVLCLITLPTKAQYYYNDLIALKQWEQKAQTYRTEKVSKITETAILPSGEKQTNYTQFHTISQYADTLLTVRSMDGFTITTQYLLNRSGHLLSEIENQPGMRTEIEYTRDDAGQIRQITHVHTDSLLDFVDHEIHEWIYDANKKPTGLLRIVKQFDGTFDTSTVRFISDEKGQIIEEQTFKNKSLSNFFYYYYDATGNLTDIVRYNEKWKRLLPDQLFEYDEKNRLIQRMQLTGSRDVAYLIWRYGYESNGLLKEEALFNNKKEFTGSIRYFYSRQIP